MRKSILVVALDSSGRSLIVLSFVAAVKRVQLLGDVKLKKSSSKSTPTSSPPMITFASALPSTPKRPEPNCKYESLMSNSLSPSVSPSWSSSAALRKTSRLKSVAPAPVTRIVTMLSDAIACGGNATDEPSAALVNLAETPRTWTETSTAASGSSRAEIVCPPSTKNVKSAEAELSASVPKLLSLENMSPPNGARRLNEDSSLSRIVTSALSRREEVG